MRKYILLLGLVIVALSACNHSSAAAQPIAPTQAQNGSPNAILMPPSARESISEIPKSGREALGNTADSISAAKPLTAKIFPCLLTSIVGSEPNDVITTRLRIERDMNGTITTATIVPEQNSLYTSDPTFRLASNFALQTVRKIRPVLYTDQYDIWKNTNMDFHYSRKCLGELMSRPN